MIITQIIRRIGQMIIVLFVLSTITFILMKLTPGDPVNKILHLDVANVSASQVSETKEKLGLNQPIIVQYGQWLNQIVHLNFGTSYQTGESVSKELLYYTPPTLLIALATMVTVLLISIPLGTVAARYYHTWIDMLIRMMTSITVSIPSFFLGTLLIYICATISYLAFFWYCYTGWLYFASCVIEHWHECLLCKTDALKFIRIIPITRGTSI